MAYQAYDLIHKIKTGCGERGNYLPVVYSFYRSKTGIIICRGRI